MEDVDARRVKALNDSRGHSNVVEELVDRIEVRLLCDGENETSSGEFAPLKNCPSGSLAYRPAMDQLANEVV
jgi:hypothetical protein